MTGIYTTRTFYKLEKEKKKKTLENEIIIFFFYIRLYIDIHKQRTKKKWPEVNGRGDRDSDVCV